MDVDVPDNDDLGEPVTAAAAAAAPTPIAETAPPPPPPTPPSMNLSQRRLDPKLLDKPESFDGVGTSWRVWKLRAAGWLSAVDTRLRHLLPAAERSDAVLEVVADEVVALDTFLFTQLLVWLEG